MICGFGIYDGEKGKAYNSNIIYKLWSSMIERCYSDKMLKNNPTYNGTKVCDEWKYYSNFEKWAIVHYVDGYYLDKDIALGDMKLYSPDTCSFVPAVINSCILDKTTNNKLPIGVSKINSHNGYIRPKSYKASMSYYGKPTYIKACTTPEEAHLYWQNAKIEYLKELVVKFSDIDVKAINGIKRRISILENDVKNDRITVTINKI